jgi:hypothetical protein
MLTGILHVGFGRHLCRQCLKKKACVTSTQTLFFLFLPVNRSDDRLASDYNIEGGSVLHLVLALRGGC